jgi:putative zinc finger/helix-turn-helix YgiT family protein
MQVKEARPDTQIVRRVCYDCGGVMEGRRGSEYNYTECGLQKVRLQNILVFRCKNPQCGAEVPEIPNVSELHDTIAMGLISKPTLLTGEEIRFLRQMANLSGIQMASMLGIHKTQLSRWENGKRDISKKSDVALRLLSFACIMQEKLRNEEILPKIQSAAKMFSHVDLTKILEGVQEIMKGSKSVVIDLPDASNLDKVDHLELAESVH